MKGLMYIAGSFETVTRARCGAGERWVDNDPHFWTSPPTWGICRNDLRRRAEPGDYIFFVLPKAAKHPQCLFAYMKIKEIISHRDAYVRKGLRSKRMSNKRAPNGNIIVNAAGSYNRYDYDAHRDIFHKVHPRYAIGYPNHSRFLNDTQIRRLAPTFVSFLQTLLNRTATSVRDLVTQYGRTLSEGQIEEVVRWVDS